MGKIRNSVVKEQSEVCEAGSANSISQANTRRKEAFPGDYRDNNIKKKKKKEKNWHWNNCRVLEPGKYFSPSKLPVMAKVTQALAGASKKT